MMMNMRCNTRKNKGQHSIDWTKGSIWIDGKKFMDVSCEPEMIYKKDENGKKCNAVRLIEVGNHPRE